jgi:hypothetical protein
MRTRFTPNVEPSQGPAAVTISLTIERGASLSAAPVARSSVSWRDQLPRRRRPSRHWQVASASIPWVRAPPVLA